MPHEFMIAGYTESSDCRKKLKHLSLDELMITTVLLMNERPKSIPKDKESLISVCINELNTLPQDERIALIDRAISDIQTYAASTDESKWIKDPMPKRLEAFLRKILLNQNWIDVEGASNKSRFLLEYNLQTIWEYTEDKEDQMDQMDALQREWSKLNEINELQGIAETDTKDFLEHFSKEYKKLIRKSSLSFSSRKTQPIHIDTIEDALICLDLFNSRPLERSAITDKIRKSWQQKLYRRNSGKTQKGFNLSAHIISSLKKIANKNNLNETEVISILIIEELKNELYIKEALDRAAIRQRAQESE